MADIRENITLPVLDSWAKLLGYRIVSKPGREVILEFDSAFKAFHFADLLCRMGDTLSAIELIGPVMSIHATVVLMKVTTTGHAQDLCDRCNGCTRNACEPHSLCYCE